MEILTLSSTYLKEKNVSEPRLSSEILIAHALGIKRLDIYLKFDIVPDENELEKIRGLIKRRGKNEPVQYITGETEFFGLPFRVNRSVLIPRHDTEVLVEQAVKTIGKSELNILEIGTGSGCIAISIASKCPNALITATDISDVALDTASKNAELNKVSGRIKFLKHDILKGSFKDKFDMIISNPPYIRKNVTDNLEEQVKKYEPLSALTDNADGLTFYRRINDILPQALKDGGHLLLEIGYDQENEIREIYKKSLAGVIITRDLSNNPRVLSGIKI